MTFVLIDHPRPVLPNEVHVGGMTTKPAKPLPKELEEFMNANTRGTIVVSFGSIANKLPSPTANARFMQAFAKLDLNVIWRYIGEGSLFAIDPNETTITPLLLAFMNSSNSLGRSLAGCVVIPPTWTSLGSTGRG
jgi:hypothetical protein